MIKGTYLEPLLWWAYGAIAVSGVLGVGYATVQQVYRTGLDDPQVQIAEDAALTLQKGGVPAEVVNRNTPLFDMQESLAPWVAVFDQSGLTLESSASLNNAPPKLPLGLFDTATWLRGNMYTQNGMQETRVTWQPQNGVRQAVVLVKVNSRLYVASGRNMRDVEQRIEHEGEIVFAGWLVTLAALLGASFAGGHTLRRRRN